MNVAGPLCACCEEVPADVKADGWPLLDRDLGLPVCVCCFEWLYYAKCVLRDADFDECAALGPGPHLSGGLGS